MPTPEGPTAFTLSRICCQFIHHTPVDIIYMSYDMRRIHDNQFCQQIRHRPDNEASKGDSPKAKDGEKGHNRTSSAVKKPTSFKLI